MDGKRGPAEEHGSDAPAGAEPAAPNDPEAPGATGAPNAPGAPGGPDAGTGPAGTRERYGPLIVERLRKDDGRALLAFSRARDRGSAP